MSRRGIIVPADSPLLDELMLPRAEVKQVKEGTLFCSFCGKQTTEDEATKGSGRPRKSFSLTIDHYNQTFEDNIKHFVDKLVACPACCLNIKPLYNSKGELVSKGAQFPKTDG